MFFLYNRGPALPLRPVRDVTTGDTACGGTRTHGCDLIVTGPLDPFLVRLKIAGYGGIALAIPIIFWEIWRFVTPGPAQARAALRRSRSSSRRSCCSRWARSSRGSRVDKALEFLLGVGGSSIQPFITADKYLTLVTLMIIAFGVAFEFPLLIMFLLLVRVVNTRQLRHARRWVAVGITIFAAVITPSQDPFSLLFMAVPMYIFYEIAIVIGRLMKR